jgi:hypothetical protein
MTQHLGVAVLVVVVAAGLLLLASCSLYHHEFKTTTPANKPYELFVIQSDDFGSLWSVPTAQQILGHIKTLSDQENVTVVVFIHGWHHNADPLDDNYTGFEQRLAAMDARLNTPHMQAVRSDSSGQGGTHVIGIYIAWRGRVLPGFLDYITMWSRKDAAERVGDGDVREFILRLQRQYLRANSIQGRSDAPRPHMGLITFGHSFGAQVLIKAIGTTVERSFTERTDWLASDVEPPPSPPHSPAVYVPIDSFGDINILINPATEAYQYDRIDTLMRQPSSYPWCQLPQILVLSSDKDTARSRFFPLARGVTRPFRPAFRNHEQGALFGTALGMLESQQTHQLKVTTENPSLEDSDYGSTAGQMKILRQDFSGKKITFSNVTLDPKSGPAIEYCPSMVATEPGVLIRDHNDIFQDRLWDFLIDYVSFLEGKRLLVQKLRQQQGVSTGRCPDLAVAHE